MPMTDTPAPRGFLHRPEPKAIGHAGRGEQIIEGRLHLGGVTLTGAFFDNDMPVSVAAEPARVRSRSCWMRWPRPSVRAGCGWSA